MLCSAYQQTLPRKIVHFIFIILINYNLFTYSCLLVNCERGTQLCVVLFYLHASLLSKFSLFVLNVESFFCAAVPAFCQGFLILWFYSHIKIAIFVFVSALVFFCLCGYVMARKFNDDIKQVCFNTVTIVWLLHCMVCVTKLGVVFPCLFVRQLLFRHHLWRGEEGSVLYFLAIVYLCSKVILIHKSSLHPTINGLFECIFNF